VNSGAWLPLAVLAYCIFAVNGVVDKIIVSKKIKNPVEVSFWVSLTGIGSCVILLGGLLPAPYGRMFWFQLPGAPAIWLILFGSVLLQVGLLLQYTALRRGEATRVVSAIGATVPVFTLLFAYAALHERMSAFSYIAFAVLLIGAVTMLWRRGGSPGAAFALAVSSAGFMAGSSVVAKDVFAHNQFVSSLALFALGNVVYCLMLLAISGSMRVALVHAVRPKRKRTAGRLASSGGAFILGNSVLGGIGAVSLNLAISLGSVTLVNALRGLQYVGVFVIAVALSRFVPKLLKEELTGQTMEQKLAGIGLIGAGLALITVLAR
jgi:drug/metabolite transporter (DMT)-like permease